MSKYIDTEKLIFEIERLKKDARKNAEIAQNNNNVPVAALWSGKESVCSALLAKITSLQQDKETLELCSKIWWEEQGWIMIPPDATIEGIESLLKQVRKKLQQEQSKKFTKKNCNNCPHCIERKDQIGWHFRGCFGGQYKGKPIIEIEECPLQQEQSEIDLEKEIDSEWKKCNPIDEGMGVESAYIHIEAFDMIARHFSELGRKQVLQEIYDGKTKPVDKITAAWLDD